MADLSSQLAAALGLSYAKPDYAAEDYYAPYAGLANQIQGVTNQANQYSTKDRLIATALTGLLGGVAQGYSDDYQTRAKDAFANQVLGNIYGKPVSADNESILGSKLFKVADENSALFKVAQQQDLADFGKELYKQDNAALNTIKANVIKAIADNPRDAQRILSSLPPDLADKIGINIPARKEEAPIVTPKAEPDIGPDLGLKSLPDIENELFQQKLEAGVPAIQASASARSDVEDRRKRAKELMGAKLSETNDSIGQAEDIIRKGREGILKAGKTGSSIASTYEAALSYFPNLFPEAARQAEGDQLLKLTQNLGASLNRLKGSGALSDFESKALFETAMSPTRTVPQNEAVLRGYENGLAALKEYQGFTDYFLTKTAGNPDMASTLWQLYKQDNPIVVQDPNTGDYVINQNRTPWQKYDFKDAYKQFLTGERPTQANQPVEQIGGNIPAIGSTFNGEKVISIKKIR